MKNNNFKIFLTLTLLLTMIFGCTDKKTYNDELSVIFYSNTGSSSIVSTKIETMENVKKNSKIQKPNDPQANGAIFKGWYKDPLYNEEWDFEEDIVTKSMVLYAKWEIRDFIIRYHFENNLGYLVDPEISSYSPLKTVTLPKAERLGSKFEGWILTSPSEYKPGDKILNSTEGFSQDLDLYAYFINNEYQIRFRSNKDDVKNPTIHIFKYLSELELPVLENTSDSLFVGWFTKDGTNDQDWGYEYKSGDIFYGIPTKNPTTGEWEFKPGNIILYAKWQVK